MGRAARNVRGRAILYADAMTDSMRAAIGETERRRRVQEAYNTEHGITPASIVKNIEDVLSSVYERDYVTVPKALDERDTFKTQAELDAFIGRLEKEMREAAANLEFERAASLRDRLKRLRNPDLRRRVQAGADDGLAQTRRPRGPGVHEAPRSRGPGSGQSADLRTRHHRAAGLDRARLHDGRAADRDVHRAWCSRCSRA